MTERTKASLTVGAAVLWLLFGLAPLLMKPEKTYDCDGEIVKVCNTFASRFFYCDTGEPADGTRLEQCDKIGMRVRFRFDKE